MDNNNCNFGCSDQRDHNKANNHDCEISDENEFVDENDLGYQNERRHNRDDDNHR